MVSDGLLMGYKFYLSQRRSGRHETGRKKEKKTFAPSRLRVSNKKKKTLATTQRPPRNRKEKKEKTLCAFAPSREQQKEKRLSQRRSGRHETGRKKEKKTFAPSRLCMRQLPN